ncbi:MAG: hypothetical protein KDE51_18670 [Anaerolineales bacterium]|nr:hypothetical protein [Anaerolineales bacterium]
MLVLEQLQEYLPALKRGWWLIALTTLFAISLALYASYTATPIYQTNAKVIILPNPLLERDTDLLKAQEVLADQSLQTNQIEVLKSSALREKAIAIMPLTPAQLSTLSEYEVSAVLLPQTSVIQLTVTGPDPQVASLLANALVEQGNIVFAQTQSTVYTIEFLDAAAVPTTPISPTPARDAPVAGIVGLALGLGLVFAHDFLFRVVAASRASREEANATMIEEANASADADITINGTPEHDPEVHPAEA